MFSTDGPDFVGISGRQLVFSPTVNSITVPVGIIDDDLEEFIETFSANLNSDVPRLVLLHDETTVDIIDDENDSK